MGHIRKNPIACIMSLQLHYKAVHSQLLLLVEKLLIHFFVFNCPLNRYYTLHSAPFSHCKNVFGDTTLKNCKQFFFRSAETRPQKANPKFHQNSFDTILRARKKMFFSPKYAEDKSKSHRFRH